MAKSAERFVRQIEVKCIVARDDVSLQGAGLRGAILAGNVLGVGRGRRPGGANFGERIRCFASALRLERLNANDILSYPHLWQLIPAVRIEHYLTATVLAGDYNNNGVIDAADFVVWRNSSSSATLPNDTTPGNVSAADYAVWRSNFGNALSVGAAAAAAVPEPEGLLLAIVAGLVYIGRVALLRP